ncbi:transmembrane protein 26 [Culicoides brevitarsis]|uniref:transmembrane protein 26 n=1 Tax=Culicoides brevitarsis TaxID=469753 RepID=UPI00307BE8D8
MTQSLNKLMKIHKMIATIIKAVITRIIFAAHSATAIWQVVHSRDSNYWLLAIPLGFLFFEGIFTLTIKQNQEWRWFCPSVFFYLLGVVPAIWLLELDKMRKRENMTIASVGKDFKNLDKFLGVNIKLPNIEVDAETWVTLIEQFLMLILIVGRWLLPKGDLTRDQLSQLLLVYIGTAADIIEFFDSFKDEKIAGDYLLAFLTLGIWSWSLMQFTIVLSATRSRKPRGTGPAHEEEDDECCGKYCCGIDAWGIVLNILLQDAPFLTFRLLIIIHYKIISYMNVFFTCKNTLVILLQLYRLYVVYSENHKHKRRSQKFVRNRHPPYGWDVRSFDSGEVFMISNGKYERPRRIRRMNDDFTEISERRSNRSRKDTGYSTGSSNENRHRIKSRKSESESNYRHHNRSRKKHSSPPSDTVERERKSKNRDKKRKVHPESDDERYEKKSSRQQKRLVEVTEESDRSPESDRKTKRHPKKKKHLSTESDTTESD